MFPENLDDFLSTTSAHIQKNLTLSSAQFDLYRRCRSICQLCELLQQDLSVDTYKASLSLLRGLQQLAEAARNVGVLIINYEYDLRRRGSYQSGNDSGSPEKLLDGPFQIVNNEGTISLRTQKSTSVGIRQFRCTFGFEGTNFKQFTECREVSRSEAEWEIHESYHDQPAQGIYPIEYGRESFLVEPAGLEEPHRQRHQKTGDMEELIEKQHVRRNHERSFSYPHCDNVVRHSVARVESDSERSRHLSQKIKDLGDAFVWVENPVALDCEGMEMKIV